ncbi:T9SS type A sorting domain-containing protein, partial [Flavobacteriaceae bacterium]|nr:T9SS type A sorting domain-containing protein [Flavobacteriaceae bacterium]
VTIFMNFNVVDPATQQTYYWDNLEQVDVLITGDARISEIDADQTGTDTEEFLEIQTEFANQSLNGMIAVLYNGNGAISYTTVDLNGFTSDDNGYFLIGTDAVAGVDISLGADNTIQNGADGVALYMADAASFPEGTAATDVGLVDAVVYGTNDSDATDLLVALGETIQWNESENGANGTESLQWDDATQGFCAGVPTPKAANTPCPVTSDGLSCATAFVATEGLITQTQIVDTNGGINGGDAAWFVYTPSANGSIIVSSCLGGADTRLNIWNECDDAASAATNDDECAYAPDGTGDAYASQIDGFVVAGGEDYFIQWDDRWSQDPFDWSITFIPAPLVELPITLEGGQSPAFGDFNGSSTQIIANPDPAGNGSATVAENTVPANAATAGVNFPLDTNIDITVDKFFTLKVWSPVANTPVLLKLENASGANAEVAATTTTTSAWETISFDFSAIGQLTYESVTLFMNFNVLDPADQTYYWDDLELVNEIVVPNDLCENALAIDCGATYTGDTSNFFNTGAPEEDCGTGLDTAPGAWHTLTIPADGDYTVTVNTVGSAFDTKLGIFSGSCDALVCVDGNDDIGGGVLQSEVTFVGTASETYILYVTGFAANAGVYNLNVACELIPPPPVVELPITFEDGQLPILNDFNGSATQVIANPDASGANDSATVAENVVPANAGFAGVNFAVENLDITTLKGFTMTVWSQVPEMPVLLKLENATTGVNAERAATTTTTGAWETISFDFSEEGDLTFESVTVFMNFNVLGDTDQTYYWDNLVQGEPLDVTQNDLVDIAMYPNPATSVVTLEASQEIATIQIMNLLGQTVSIIEVNNTSSTVNVSQLRTGVYFANVLFSNGSVQTMKFIKE